MCIVWSGECLSVALNSAIERELGIAFGSVKVMPKLHLAVPGRKGMLFRHRFWLYCCKKLLNSYLGWGLMRSRETACDQLVLDIPYKQVKTISMVLLRSKCCATELPLGDIYTHMSPALNSSLSLQSQNTNNVWVLARITRLVSCWHCWSEFSC